MALSKAIEQANEDVRLLEESAEVLKKMKLEQERIQLTLDDLNQKNEVENKHLTKANDEYKAKVAELKQKNIDDHYTMLFQQD